MPRVKTKAKKVPKAAPKAPARIPGLKQKKVVAPSDRVTRRQARLNSDPEPEPEPAPPKKPAKKTGGRGKRAPPPPPPPPMGEDDGEEWFGIEEDEELSEEELEHVAVKPRKSILRAPRKRVALLAPKTKARVGTPGPIRSRGRSRESSSAKSRSSSRSGRSSSRSGRSSSRSGRSSSRSGRSSSPSGSDSKHVHFEDDDWVDDEDDVDAIAAALYEKDNRSNAFSAPSGSRDAYSGRAGEDYDNDAMLVDDESDRDAHRGASARKRSRRASAAEQSADRGSKKARFSRLEQFVAGKKPKTNDAFITNVARKIIAEEFRSYLPLHAFSDEIREQEANSRVVCIGDDENEKTKLSVKLHERDVDYETWGMWADQMMAALAAMGVPRSIHGIFYRHFHNVRQGRLGLLGSSSAWPPWRAYDILVRRTFNYDDLPDIGIFDDEAFKHIVNEGDDARRKAQVDLNARTERLLNAKSASLPAKSSGHASSSNAQASSSRSSKSAQTSSKSSTSKDTSSYECCILCGLQTHIFHKDKAAKQECAGKPLWLVYDKSDEVYKIPGTNTVACWTFNSKEGCNKRDCRLRGHGHRCSLCGAEDHGCHKCPKRA